MEQYKSYLEETYVGQSCYIDPKGRGWASYKITGEECYINHCWLHPDHRGKTLMSELCSNIEKIALESGCTYMTGTVEVSPDSKVDPIISLKMMHTDGYRLHSANNNIIVLVKKLKG
jgi:GNAT superfamily N-acetyltransferase